MRLRRPSPAAAALAALAAASAACFPGALPPKPPVAPVRGELAPRAALAPRAPEAGPLRVVYAGPSGETGPSPEITLVFSKPMRAIGADPRSPEAPVRITPALPGAFSWVGSSALQFVPEKPFPPATAFRVEVPADTRALDGSALEAPFVLSFSTPRPSVSGSEPARGATGIRPDATITLFFTQAVKAAEISRAVTIDAGRGPVPYSIVEVTDDRAVLAPRAPLPRDKDVLVRIDASLRGAEGELSAGKAEEIRFRTLGPAGLASAECHPHPLEKDRCDPTETTITLKFATPISDEVLERAIAVDPRPDSFHVSGSYDDGESSREVYVNGDFEPGKTYRVEVRTQGAGRAFQDIHGQRLPANVRREFRFGDLPAELIIGARGTYWVPDGKRILPIGVTNTVDATVSLIPLDKDQVLAKLAGNQVPLVSPSLTFAAPAGKRNEDRWSRLVVQDHLPPGVTSGPVLVRAGFRGAPEQPPKTAEHEMQLTDLGPLTKIAPDEALVWLTRLSNAAPVKGARVEVHYVPPGGRPSLLGAAEADDKGLASIPLRIPPRKPGEREAKLAVVARSGDDWMYQSLSAPPAPEPVGRLFSARGIYRPGEQVELKGVLRVPVTAGLDTPRGREVTLRILDPERRPISTTRHVLSRFGTFATVMPLAEDAPLGHYRAEAELDGERIHWGFSVDHYRPVESKAEARLDKQVYEPGERMSCTAHGEMLYGAPMAGGRASIVVTRGSGEPSVPGLDDYLLTEHDVRVASAQIAQGTGKLDGHGAFSPAAPLVLPGQTAVETVTCRVEIMDLNQQTRYAEDSALVYPASVLVALSEDDRYWVKPGDKVTPRVLVVTPAGERRSHPVHLEFSRRARRDDNAVEDRTVGTCDVTSGAAPVGCDFTIPTQVAGTEYEVELIVRATTKDEKGRRAAASYSLHVEPPATTPSPPPPPPPPPPTPPSAELVLRLDRSEYRVGQTARLVLESPHSKPNQALVTFEREGLLFRRVVPLAPAGTQTIVDVPITFSMMPNAAIKVVTLSGTREESREAAIAVSPEDRMLDVEVRPSKLQAAPGETLDVEVLAKDAAGKPVQAEITLWAADEGSLMLTYYITPEPFEAIYDPRYSSVRTSDVRDDLLRTFSGRRAKPPLVRMGATSVSPRRGDFRQTVAFFPDLVTDASGRVKRRIKLPDGLTAYRFMAMAVAEDDRTGSDDATVLTSKPLMARPSIPLALRAGDQFEASVVLSALDIPGGNTVVTASAEGLTPAGPMRREATVDPEHPALVRFPFRAERAGKARLSFEASLQDETDGVDLKTQIAVPTTFETAALTGETSSAIAERLGDLGGLRKDVGGLSISLASTPLSGLAAGIEQLVEYPYGCTEQTVSRMVPLLALRDLADSLGVPLVPGQTSPQKGGNVDAALRESVDRLLTHQQKDGSFGLWPGSSEGDPYITAYALWGLDEARRRGLPVPAGALDRAAHSLASSLAAPFAEANPSSLERAAFALDVLAMARRPDESRMRALFGERARMPLLARALLLHAFAVAGRGGGDESRELLRDLETNIRIDGPGAHVASASEAKAPWHEFDSSVRTDAAALLAIVATNPTHPLAARLSRGILDGRAGGAYRTTHEAAWALLALDAYRKKNPAPLDPVEARVFLGDTLLADAPLGGESGKLRRTAFVSMSDLLRGRGAPLTFEAVGGGRLHYEAVLRYAREDMPREPLDAGFYLTKSFRPVADLGGPVLAASAAAERRFDPGQVVLCEIEVVTREPRRFVVLEDPVPGGLEPMRFAHDVGGPWLANLQMTPAERREMRGDRVVYFIDRLPAGITRFRYLARAAHVGRFVAPPTHIEEMYAPETFGRTGGTYVRVGAK
ncbi:Ig-like domain-containing alpha-2-macroglobulin family protein [Polyangium jinanense]|uniref:Ig-like domain-containing protein n=1 Tax=Polyangium jinanense TaxID=2829994 RepID=A0A9X4AVH9_9BACT|nr:Ig-like domain-containing alpha-2-macroglobulin family protein [Polyangium jinanense]MDC3959292.1 Ig-like domain-containing protein [Polyangium jinanense]MDC3985701.1 Ig-like domain-containing protein [Polyangium jinanense]